MSGGRPRRRRDLRLGEPMRSSRPFRSVTALVVAVLGPLASAAGQTPRPIVAPHATASVPLRPAGPTVTPTVTVLPYQVVVWHNGVRGVVGAAYNLTNANGSAPPGGGVSSPQPQVLVVTLPAGNPAAQALSGMSACVAPVCQLEIDKMNTTGQVGASYLLSLAVQTPLATPPPVATSAPSVRFALAYQIVVVKSRAATATDDWYTGGP
jgi:hypothetical protein